MGKLPTKHIYFTNAKSVLNFFPNKQCFDSEFTELMIAVQLSAWYKGR